MSSKVFNLVVMIAILILSFITGIGIGLNQNKFKPMKRTLQINYIRDSQIHYLFLDVAERSPYYFEVEHQEEFTKYLDAEIIELFDYDSMRKELRN